MYTEEILLKYLDDALPLSEREILEQHLEGDTNLRARLEQVKEKRTLAMTALDALNPEVDPEVPLFHAPGRPVVFASNLLRYAAAAILLIGVIVAFFLLNRTSFDEDNKEVVNHYNELETTFEDLDCYISPNRCWNERKIPLITIKIQ